MPGPLLIDPHSPQTFHDLLEAIYAQRFTGEVPIVLHCHNGIAKEADIVVERVRIRFGGPSSAPPP